MIFKYDTNAIRVQFLKRQAIFLVLICYFFYYNAEGQNILEFLKNPSLLVSIVLYAFFSVWLLKRQTKPFENRSISLENKQIIELENGKKISEFSLNELESVRKDQFRGLNRIVLYSKEKSYQILGLESPLEFLEQLESQKNLNISKDDEMTLISKKGIFALLPSFLFLGFWGLGLLKQYGNPQTFFLVLNLNIVVVLLQIGKKWNLFFWISLMGLILQFLYYQKLMEKLFGI